MKERGLLKSYQRIKASEEINRYDGFSKALKYLEKVSGVQTLDSEFNDSVSYVQMSNPKFDNKFILQEKDMGKSPIPLQEPIGTIYNTKGQY